MSSITYSERIKIETFCELGLSNIQMGVRLNRSPSTISYELSRCQPYQAELAQTDAEYKRSRCGRKTKLSDELKQKILNHLRLSWSPGMIAHEFKLATKSIYNWLNQGRIGFSLNDLPEHGLRQRRNVDQRSKYNQSLGRSIEQRPMMINQRKRIGDFELDTVVGPRGHSKAVLLTLIDRKSRFLWAYRLKDRTTATVNEALTKFLTTFNGPVHSFTVDRTIKRALRYLELIGSLPTSSFFYTISIFERAKRTLHFLLVHCPDQRIENRSLCNVPYK
ncbi:integrase catalytic subunit (plasmid) [Lactiplantibacillus plantarum 16]|nr:integrase catalytic subunit [Lactiplantibacillus plantarum 16]